MEVLNEEFRIQKPYTAYALMGALMEELDKKEKQIEELTNKIKEIDYKRRNSQAYKVQTGEVKIAFRKDIVKENLLKQRANGKTFTALAKENKCSIMTIRRRMGLTMNGVKQ